MAVRSPEAHRLTPSAGFVDEMVAYLEDIQRRPVGGFRHSHVLMCRENCRVEQVSQHLLVLKRRKSRHNLGILTPINPHPPA